jgi:hypothetical protein
LRFDRLGLLVEPKDLRVGVSEGLDDKRVTDDVEISASRQLRLDVEWSFDIKAELWVKFTFLRLWLWLFVFIGFLVIGSGWSRLLAFLFVVISFLLCFLFFLLILVLFLVVRVLFARISPRVLWLELLWS